MVDIQTSIHGRRIGLSRLGALILNRNDGIQEILGAVTTKAVTSAQLLALNATPITVVTAAGAGLAIVPCRVAIYKPAGTAYAGVAAGEDLVLKYTNGAGAQCSGVIETTGFLDQATAQTRYVGDPGSTGATAGDVTPVANADIVLHLLVGEIITGNSPIYVRTWYDIISTVFTA